MKTAIIFNCDDQQHNDWEKGEEGYIDGYIYHGGTFSPLICAVIGKRVVLAPYNCVDVTGIVNNEGNIINY